MQHAWQEQFQVAVAERHVYSPGRGVKAGDAQRHWLLPAPVIVGTLPYVVRSKNIIWNYNRKKKDEELA